MDATPDYFDAVMATEAHAPESAEYESPALEALALEKHVDILRDLARNLYGRIIRRGPMELDDVWHWMAQMLEVDKSDACIEELTPEQYVTFIAEADRKIDEYKRRGKWADEPRRPAPWE